MWKSISIMTLLGWLMISCASITNRHQYVRFVPKDKQSKIFYDDQLLGEGPSTLYISRSAHPKLTLKTGAKTEEKVLKTRYRWGQSFGGNALMLTYAPFGWLIDYVTGAAWEAEDQIDPSASFLPDENSKLLILPPTGTSRAQSLFLGETVESWLRNKEPKLKVLGFKENYSHLVGLGFDHESSRLSDDKDVFGELIYETEATHLVFSQYDEASEAVQISIYSPYSDKIVKEMEMEKVLLQQQSTWEWITSESFELFPNTIAVGSNQTNYGGCAFRGVDEARYCANQGKVTPLNFISSFSLLNILHYRKRETWALYFRFTPFFNLSYNQVEFEKAEAAQPDLNVDWIYSSFGYGPRLSFILPVGEMFLELVPFYAFNYVRVYSNNLDETKWFGNLGLASQFGLNSWLSNHWNLRIFGSVETQSILPEHDISSIDPGTRFDGSVSIFRSGISVGYYFHEEKTKFFNWLGIK